MVPSEKPPSLQEILKRRQQEGFVGREEQLAFFRENLGFAPEDPRRRFIISISGQGGVGKTWLQRRFRKISEEARAIIASTDEAEQDVPSVMGRIAEQFETQDYPLKTFAERYKVYCQRRQEIEADPGAPQGFPAFLGRMVAKGGLHLARRVPVGGLVADFVEEEAFASLAGDFTAYVAHKIRNKDEVRLVLEPVEVLTPLFLADLRKVGEGHTLALFFDTYERTGGFLDSWLRDLLEDRHGDVPADILIVVAGRDELDRNHWAPYEGLLARLPLEPFSEEEAHDYLARKGITDERVVEVILALSGRLPLLVATLAAESPDDPAQVGDPSGEAVERFLKWVEDPKQRQVALDAALPRRLNRDVLAVLVGREEADVLFAWLRGMPFVERRGDGWAYHDVVRGQMLRYKQQEAPQGWADLHGWLAEYHEGLRDGLGLEEKAGRKVEAWQGYALEALYHRLCQAPHRHLPTVLDGFLAALDAQHTFARHWAGIVRQAGKDARAAKTRCWAERLINGLKAYDYGRYEAVVEMFTALLGYSEIGEQWRPIALGHRGAAYREMKRYNEALADFNRAIQLDPEYAWAIGRRAEIYRLMERYDEALADCNHAIELQPDLARVIANRGKLYRLKGLYEKALADFNHVLELQPDDAWSLDSRGETYRQMGLYKKALADFNRVLELWLEDAWALAHRGVTYLQMGRYVDALADLNRAIELQHEEDWRLYGRALAYQLHGRENEARADLTAAIQLVQRRDERGPQKWSNIFRLALYHLALGEATKAEYLYRKALSGVASPHLIPDAIRDLDDFLSLFPDHPQARAMRDLLQEYLQEAE